MASTFGSCSSGSSLLTSSVEDAGWIELLTNTAARSARRASASRGVMSPVWFGCGSPCATVSTLATTTIYWNLIKPTDTKQTIYELTFVLLRRQLGSLFSDDCVNRRSAWIA